MTHNIQDLIASERERWLKLHLEGSLTMVELAKRSGFARSTLYFRQGRTLALAQLQRASISAFQNFQTGGQYYHA